MAPATGNNTHPPLHFSILATARKLFRPFSVLFLVFMTGIVVSSGNSVQLTMPQPTFMTLKDHFHEVAINWIYPDNGDLCHALFFIEAFF